MRIVKFKNEPSGLKPCTAALGFFDGVHLGHARVLQTAAAQGLPVAAVTFSEKPGGENGDTKLILSPELKERALAKLGAQAVVYLDFDAVRDKTPAWFVNEVLINALGVRTAVCGFNYRFGRGACAGPRELADLLQKQGAQAVTVPAVDVNGAAVSATRIRALIAQGAVDEAAELLGRPFSLRLQVEHGRQLGRKLGFPTINQRPPSVQLLPCFGVYATAVLLADGTRLPAVTNVGVKPTVDGGEPLSETYIHGFTGDLYGTTVEVEFLKFIRPEERFAGLDELKSRMALDCRESLRMQE